MSTGLIVALAVGGTMVFGAVLTWFIIVVGRKMNAERAHETERLRAGATARGWRYEQRDDTYANLLPFTRSGMGTVERIGVGKVKRVDHVTTGTYRGRWIFGAFFRLSRGDRQYVPGAGLNLPAPLPGLSVRRAPKVENLVNRSIGRSGWRSGNPEFNARFDVEADDPRLAAAMLQPDMQNWLLHDESTRRWDFWIHGEWLYLGGLYGNFKIDTMIEGIDFLCAVFDRMPESVRGPTR